MLLTRDQIFAAPKLISKRVHIPEWGGDVLVKVMTLAERDAWELAVYGDDNVNQANFRAALIVKTVCDEAGKPLFADADIPALAGEASAAYIRLAKVAMKLNAMSDKDVDEMTKN